MDTTEYNPLQVECTLFFQENPYAFETTRGLAFRLGRNPADLTEVLNRLVQSMILEVIGTGENAIYHYVQPEVTINLEQQEQI